MKNTVFIINPRSAKGKYKEFLTALKTYISEPNYLISQSKEHTATFIKENMDNYEIFVAVGGDGTISSIAQYLINTDKILGLFPMGSGNGFGRENNFNHNLKELLEKLKYGNSKKIDMINIGEEYSVNVSGVGLDSAVANGFENSSRGFLNYIKISAKTFLQFKGIKVQFKNPELAQYNDNYFMVNIANTRQFGNNAYIAPQALTNDGKMEIALVKKFPLYLAPKFVYQLFTKKLQPSPYLQYITTDECELVVDSDLWHIDGDAQKITSPIKMKVIPLCLNVLID